MIDTNRAYARTRADELEDLNICASVPYLKELLEPATFVPDVLYARPDYSYYSAQVYGENFFCIGDAATLGTGIVSFGPRRQTVPTIRFAWPARPASWPSSVMTICPTILNR